MPQTKTAAIVTINSPATMSKRGRKAIAAWLIRTANDLVEHGKDYSTKRFTARYLYR